MRSGRFQSAERTANVDDMDLRPGERLRLHWGVEGAVREGASQTALTALEQELRIVLPADFRDYLAVVEGMESGKWVGNEIEFWPIARIREEADNWGCFEPGVEGTLLPFADFLINSHAYAIRVSSTDAPVFVVLGGLCGGPQRWQVIQCARSFEEFVTRYEQNHTAIYGG